MYILDTQYLLEPLYTQKTLRTGLKSPDQRKSPNFRVYIILSKHRSFDMGHHPYLRLHTKEGKGKKDTVLVKDELSHLLTHPCESHGRVDGQTSSFLYLENSTKIGRPTYLKTSNNYIHANIRNLLLATPPV